MPKSALLILAPGFEEIEAVTIIDILRRSGVDLVIAALDSIIITGAHDISISADKILENSDLEYDAFILPGGMPGSENLANSEILKDILISSNTEGKIIAAICAAPGRVLAKHGLLEAKKATGYPGTDSLFPPDCQYSEEAVQVDGNIITSRGPATSMLFALEIVEVLMGAEKMQELSDALLFGQ